MGYVKSGYASRPNKRAKKVTEKLYYEHIAKLRNRETKSNRNRQGSERSRLRLQDLSRDVLERIFVFSGRNSPLPLLNWHFFKCLKPSQYLIEQYLRVNFVFDVNAALKPSMSSSYRPWWVLADCALEVPLILRFLNASPSFLDFIDEIAVLEDVEATQQLRFEQFNDKTLPNLETPLNTPELNPTTEKSLRDFPATVYKWPALFFQNDIFTKPVVYNQLLLRLHSEYAIQSPSLTAESVMQWFFIDTASVTLQLDINCLFFALNLITHLSVQNKRSFEDVHPLIHFIDFLYISVTPRLLPLLLCEKLQDQHLISARKAKIVGKFIRKFYSHDLSLLCEDDLWIKLNEVKDHTLVERVSGFGGKPGFNVVK
ncbi:LAFA_0E11782g1_1 [Lachancea sp. 'fantastica']|nr:LAFA_0E11782g1_1 [Lachancea sp. 'fantastica']